MDGEARKTLEILLNKYNTMADETIVPEEVVAPVEEVVEATPEATPEETPAQ
jgi:hypothetical protein